MTAPIYVIIVTHNSAEVLPSCLAALDCQTRRADMVIVVDSGSTDSDYLKPLQEKFAFNCIEKENIGFARANNLGISVLPQISGTVVFMNPDTYLLPDALARAEAILASHQDVAVVGGKLLAYDLLKQCPTGRLDSTGIFRLWYGRWIDRGQGEEDSGQYDSASLVPAVCGALMCCRLQTLLLLPEGVFDEKFFLYKEDIELCLRLRENGWKLLYDPTIMAYHCRGWQTKRSRVPYALRRMAAENEVCLYKKHRSPYILWALFKYLLVKYLHI
jgi:GT2 family glycosyltransferase